MVSGNPGGIENLMKNYDSFSSHENCFVFFWGGGAVTDDIKHAVTLDVRRDGMLKSLKKVSKLCASEGFDAAVSHHSAPFLKIVLLWLKFRFPGLRIFCYAHANARIICEVERKRGLWLRKWVHAAAFRRCDGVIAISESVKRSLVDYLRIPRDKVRVIHNGVPISQFAAPPRSPGSPVKLIYVGRLVPEKGVQQTLCALQNVRADFTFTIVGDGPCREELQNLAQELGLGHRVRFLGTRADIPELLAGADIFVHFPACEEGFGLTVIEAMAAGCVCVCANSGGIPEIITDGVNGYLAQPRELERVITDFRAGRCENLRAMGAVRSAEFSIERFTAALDGLLGGPA